MKDHVSRSLYFQNRVYEAGELARSFRDLTRIYATTPTRVTISLTQNLPDGTMMKKEATVDDLEHICDLAHTQIESSFGTTEDRGHIFCVMSGSRDLLAAHIFADSGAHLSAFSISLQELLRLTRVEITPRELLRAAGSIGERVNENLAALDHRLTWLEETVFATPRTLRCFLSYRFIPEDELTALRIRQFLTLLEVDVVTGASYEPRRIREKVLARLRQPPLDFIVLLVTIRGESMWTRDEIGTATYNDLAIIPIVERGASFEPGLFGDVEYMEYEPGHIGDVFLKLLEAVRFLREQKNAGTQSNNEQA